MYILYLYNLFSFSVNGRKNSIAFRYITFVTKSFALVWLSYERWKFCITWIELDIMDILI